MASKPNRRSDRPWSQSPTTDRMRSPAASSSWASSSATAPPPSTTPYAAAAPPRTSPSATVRTGTSASRILLSQDVGVLGRFIEHRAGEGTEREQACVLGARPCHRRLDELFPGSRTSQPLVHVRVIDDDPRSSHGVSHLRQAFAVAHPDERATVVRALVDYFFQG